MANTHDEWIVDWLSSAQQHEKLQIKRYILTELSQQTQASNADIAALSNHIGNCLRKGRDDRKKDGRRNA